MVYLLKWLISLITPHTHDKEGKQGNSFIVRKALGNRASFSSLASKKGSSLLLVVMTMSVIIVISSSFMLLSFNTGIGSIFASSQQKAQLSCLSVAEGLKDGNTFGSIVNQYSGELSGNQPVEFNVNDSSLDGKTTVKLVPTVSGGSVKSVKVTVTTHVGSSKYELKFTHTMKTDSVRDVINQVTNSMSVSGGGSFSMQTGKVEGDLALDGDYLLALNTWKEINDKTDGGTGWVIYPGTVDGNVYCNGSMVLGYKGASTQIWLEETGLLSSSDKKYSDVIPTIIKENLYVNGDLIINACEIEGDVYVSGNVLVNGISSTIRGTETDQGGGRYYKDANNAVIKGNLYVGGSLYVTSGSFSRYFPEKEKVVGDSGSTIDTEGYRFKGDFPTFPSEKEIKQGSSDYTNAISSAFANTIAERKVVNDEYVFRFNDGHEETLTRDLLSVTPKGLVNFKYKGNIDNKFPSGDDKVNSDYKIDGDDDWSYVLIDDYRKMRCIIVSGKDALGWYKKKGEYKKTGADTQAYNHLMNVLTGCYWGDWESNISGPDGKTLKSTIVMRYETNAITKFSTNIDSFVPASGKDTLTVSKNVYVQGNGYVQLSDKKLGNKTVILGDLDIFTLDSYSNADGSKNSIGISTRFNNLEVGGKINNYTMRSGIIIAENENYYYAKMAISGRDTTTYNWKNGDEWPKEWTSGFYFNGQHSDFYIEGTPDDYKNNRVDSRGVNRLDYFKSANIGGGSIPDLYTTMVHGIMAYGTNGTYGECVVEYTTKRPTVISIDSRQYLFSNKTGNKNMYSEEFLKNHNSSAALRTEQKRAEEVDTVADVFKEMGVWGYSAGEVSAKSFQNAYQGGADSNPQKYFYNNLSKTGSDKEYKAGDNKLNDRGGVNFTGVTSATQIKFGYTLQRAINASKNGTITVTSKGSIKHPSAWTGDFLDNTDARDWRVLYKSQAGYKSSPVGPQNIENLTKYFVYGDGGLGNTFYGRLLFLGAYDPHAVRKNNYSETKRNAGKSAMQAVFERDMKEVMGYLYNPSLAGADSAMWEKYGKEYAGVFGYDGYGNLCIYLMRDIYLGGDSYYGFGKDTASDDVDGAGFKLFFDTSYHSVNLYIGSDANGMLNFDSDSHIEISVLFPQQGSFNVAYMYLLPNIAWSNNQSTGYSTMTYDEKVANITDIVNSEALKDASGKVITDNDGRNGQTIFKSKKTGKYYKYSVKSYAEANTGSKDRPLSSSDPALNMKFTYIVRMWDNCRIKNTAVRNSDKSLVAAGIPFVMCEGPMLFMMGQKGEMSGIIYSPNPYSVFYCASDTAYGTAASDPNTTFSGGAIVTGRVIGTRHNNGRWQFFEDSDKYDIGELLTKALIEDPNGIGDIDTSGGTNTGGNWSAGKYEE